MSRTFLLIGGVGAILAVPITLIILSVLDAFEATRWIAELARPASPARAQERDEAHHRLKDLWQKASETIKGDNGEELKEEMH